MTRRCSQDRWGYEHLFVLALIITALIGVIP